MLASINDVLLADETISGGFALSGLRLRMRRIAEVVVELGAINPVIMDRNKRRVDISFSIGRVHATIKAADTYILDHDATIPRIGDVKLITMGTETVVALIVNGALVQHELIRQYGKYTEHGYQITGSPIFAPTPGTDHLVTEAGDRITTEAGEEIIIE